MKGSSFVTPHSRGLTTTSAHPPPLSKLMDAALDVGCGAGAPLAGLVVISDGGGADGGVLVPHAVRRAVRDGYTVRGGRERGERG